MAMLACVYGVLTACLELYEVLYRRHFMVLILREAFYNLFNKHKETEVQTDELICSRSHK